MPIISTVGRRALSVRLLVWTIYGLLLFGSTTMIYPFLLMVAGSTKSSVDTTQSTLIPLFLRSELELYRKHVEALFNEHLLMMKNAYHSRASSFRTLSPPDDPKVEFAKAWTGFLAESELPTYSYTVGYVESPTSRGVLPANLRTFKSSLIDRFDGDLSRMNRAMETDFVSWNAFAVHREDFQQRRNKFLDTEYAHTFDRFKAELPATGRYYYSIEGFFRNQFLMSQYTTDIDEYNRAHGTYHDSWDQVHLDRRLPSGPGRTQLERQDWLEFVRTIVSLLWVRADAGVAPLYRDYLVAKYGDLAAFNRAYETEYSAKEELPFPEACPHTGLGGSDWEAFLQGWESPEGVVHRLPEEALRIHSVDFLFRDYLKARYRTLPALDQALGTSHQTWLDVLPPQQDWHFLAFAEQKRALRWEFLIRNFITVIDYMAVHGRGIYNTVVYCTLAVLTALIVNPVAAYALSRYKPPSAYKVLLFLMLTMAFPPMVTQIPAFLMLRELQLLNTFWALILPGVANGYSIFLLKGFFDSLPRELYESAEIDGAGEFRIFWQITMSLSQPILAVIALAAFTGAYSNFMMALLICQDESMWTLMPWLYQLQQRSGEGVIFASLIVAAVPTFVIFVFCQNVIMRGIVVPVEK
jgi:ABC-type glycerol-3-phosphate transport system permease component